MKETQKQEILKVARDLISLAREAQSASPMYIPDNAFIRNFIARIREAVKKLDFALNSNEFKEKLF